MIPIRSKAALGAILGLIAGVSSVQAQIRVDLQLAKREFVAHEPVEATITLTNHAGRDLLIHTEGVGRGAVSWLDFSVRNGQGTLLSPIQRVSFPSVRLPAGRSIAKTVDLNALYRVSDLGNFSFHAVVRLPGGGGTFNSGRASFSVTRGTPIFRQRIGDPNSRNVREFTLSRFNASDKSSLYVHLMEVRTGRTLQAFRLGDALNFNRPTATLDGQNNLHVLYLTAPGTFAHARVSPDGKHLGTEYFKRGEAGQPALQTFANGQVAVAGGAPYDPQAERQLEAKIRRLSERPAMTYR